MTTRCGTPGYVAPEVLSQDARNGKLRQYGTSCDMWSVGVIVYILLCAAPPFYGKTDAEMNRRIKTGHYRFPDKYWAHVSVDAKDFITRLLCVDPTRRMSAEEALQHNWMVSIGLYTSNLFGMAGSTSKGTPAATKPMQARFDDFNHERRSATRSQLAMQATAPRRAPAGRRACSRAVASVTWLVTSPCGTAALCDAGGARGCPRTTSHTLLATDA